jgi:hypothetical protein
MEAVAAIGIAAAAAQFLDFSIKTLALCKEIRDSSSGSTKTNDELTKSIKKLMVMQKDLRQTTEARISRRRRCRRRFLMGRLGLRFFVVRNNRQR